MKCIFIKKVFLLIAQSALPCVYSFNYVIIHLNKHYRKARFYLFQSHELGLGLDVIFTLAVNKVGLLMPTNHPQLFINHLTHIENKTGKHYPKIKSFSSGFHIIF